MSESTRGRRKSLTGIVVSVKMDKTAVVSVERRYQHQLYHKIIRSTKRYKAHDPQNSAVLGDTVRIVETRPISKQKRWRIAETMVRGNVADFSPREIGVPEEGLYRPEAPAPVAAAAPEAVAEAPQAAAEAVAVAEAPAPVAAAEPDVVAEAPEAAAEAVAEAPVAVAEPDAVAEAPEAATEAVAVDEATATEEQEAAPESAVEETEVVEETEEDSKE